VGADEKRAQGQEFEKPGEAHQEEEVTDRRGPERRRDEPSFQCRIEKKPPRHRVPGNESSRREREEGQSMSEEEERGFEEVRGFDGQALKMESGPSCEPGFTQRLQVPLLEDSRVVRDVAGKNVSQCPYGK
jgi:hypothetical protein